MNQPWTLKDKSGKSPSSEDYEKYMRVLRKLNRNLLFPCPRSPDDLEMPEKHSETAPREMNSFIIFRRQLAHIFKQRKQSDDGKVLSRVASLIWNGANDDEKQSYVRMAEELKRRHLERYPDYTPQTRAESNPVREECAPPSTSLIQEQEPENGWLYHSFTPLASENSWTNGTSTLIPQIHYDNGCYTYQGQEESRDHQCYPTGIIGDMNLPMITRSILSPNYTDVSLQHIQQQIQQQQELQQQLPQQLSLSPHYYSDYILGGGEPGIDSRLDVWAVQRPIDTFYLKEF